MGASRLRRAWPAAGALLLAAAWSGWWCWSHPVAVDSARIAWKLRRGGVRVEKLGGLRALRRDTCAQGRECRCVALIHGLGDSPETWRRLLLDDAQAGPVPAGFQVWAPYLPGTDGSPVPADPAGYGIRAQARAVRQALETACPRWVVAGNSLGGWVAAWVALDWPQGVERLVLIDPAGLRDPSGLAREAAETLSAPTVETMKEFNRRARFKPREIPERAWAEVVDRIRRRPTAATVAAIADEDFLETRLKALRVPTRLFWGEADRVLPPALGERFAAAIPGARLELLPRCGHLPQSECPAPVKAAVFAR